jgi:hypothetical protein
MPTRSPAEKGNIERTITHIREISGGAITERMTPISKTDAVLGPPNPSTRKLINELEEYEDVSPKDRSEIIV